MTLSLLQDPPFALFSATFFLAALGQAFQDAQANTFVSGVAAAHRWLGVVHASYGFGCLVGPLVATAIAAARPQKWTAFYGLLLALGVANLGFVFWTFWGEMGLGLGTGMSRSGGQEEGEEEGMRGDLSRQQGGKGKGRQVWEETKATLKERSVWLLSLFFFFYLGVGITAGGVCSLETSLPVLISAVCN